MSNKTQKQTTGLKDKPKSATSEQEAWDSPANMERMFRRSCETQLRMMADATKIRRLEKCSKVPVVKVWAERRIENIRSRWVNTY